MSQPEGQCHTGTSQVSQMIWMADRISELEDKLYEARQVAENLRNRLETPGPDNPWPQKIGLFSWEKK